MKKLITFFIVLLIICGAVTYLMTFKIETVNVEGCAMSSEDAVREAVEEAAPYDNSFLLMIKSKFVSIEDIPFVAKLDIEYTSKTQIDVTVYEKSIAGCIEYMESYVYFDRDGIVLEASKSRIENVPCIEGLDISSWELGEALPLESKKKFNTILDITQLIEKYELSIDGISFTSDGEIVLTTGNITVMLGDGSNLAVQLMNLGNILEGVEGMSGTLYMKEYSSTDKSVSFSVE